MLKPSIVFKKLIIKNGRTFRHLNVDLSDQGIISIIGQNGVGKSSMFNILEAIFYGSTSTGHKKDNLVTFGDDAHFSVDLTLREKPVRVEYSRVSGKWKHKVFVDGKAIGHHSVIEEAKEAAKTLGLSKKEFEGSVHLTQHASHVLISGLPSERKKYVAEFFDLDERWDMVWEAAKGKLAGVREQIGVLSGFSHTIAALASQLESIPMDDIGRLQHDASLAKQDLRAAVDERTRLSKAMEKAAAFQPFAQMHEVYEDPSEALEENRGFVASLERRIAKNQEAAKRNREAEALIRARTVREQEMSSILANCSTVDRYDSSEHRTLYNLRAAWDSQAAVRREYESLANAVHVSTVELEQQIADWQGQLAYLSRRHKHAQAGQCPECGQDFIGAAPSLEEANGIASALAAANQELIKVRNNNRLAGRKDALEPSLTAIPLTEAQTTRLKQLEAEAVVYQKYVQCKAALDQPVPMLVEVENDSDFRRRLDILREEGNKLTRFVQYLRQYGPGLPEVVDQGLVQHAEKRQKELELSVDACNRRLGVAQTNEATRNRIKADMDKLQNELNGLDTLKVQELFWKTMADAYGPKGLRVDALSRVMDVIIKRLPYNAGKLFDDKDMTFRHVTDAGNIEILVSRIGKHPETGEMVRYEHDISSMSGGEARRLSVALVVTMAECVVNTKRTNMLILDEVDSNLDATGKYKYINDFLPSLRGRWDTVFVISHDEEIQQAAIYDQSWKIEKRAGWSTVNINDMRSMFEHAQAASVDSLNEVSL